MISRPLVIALSLIAAAPLFAADDNAPSPSTRQMLKQRLAEESQSGAPKPVAPPTTPTATEAVAAAQAGTNQTGDKNPILTGNPSTSVPTATKPAATRTQPPTVLPKVEVTKPRITKLDQALAKEDEQIAREKKNAKPSEMDKALNDASIAKPLSIFGGESAQFRQRVSNERVSLMEDEKDLIEAIAHAKTKEEKAELQKQLDALRDERRELERALR